MFIYSECGVEKHVHDKFVGSVPFIFLAVDYSKWKILSFAFSLLLEGCASDSKPSRVD